MHTASWKLSFALTHKWRSYTNASSVHGVQIYRLVYYKFARRHPWYSSSIESAMCFPLPWRVFLKGSKAELAQSGGYNHKHGQRVMVCHTAYYTPGHTHSCVHALNRCRPTVEWSHSWEHCLEIRCIATNVVLPPPLLAEVMWKSPILTRVKRKPTWMNVPGKWGAFGVVKTLHKEY